MNDLLAAFQDDAIDLIDDGEVLDVWTPTEKEFQHIRRVLFPQLFPAPEVKPIIVEDK